MTSVGSGSLIIVALMLIYPTLVGSELVGTDLVQAVPLVAAAALGHILYGDFSLGLTASLLIGSIPGVYIGARLSAKAPDGVVRPLLAFVLLASGLKLVNMGTTELGWVLMVVAIIGLPLWGVDRRPGLDRRPLEALRSEPQQVAPLAGLRRTGRGRDWARRSPTSRGSVRSS